MRNEFVPSPRNFWVLILGCIVMILMKQVGDGVVSAVTCLFFILWAEVGKRHLSPFCLLHFLNNILFVDRETPCAYS